MIKILMSWNIRSGAEDEYFEFVMQEFAPTLLKLGVQPTDAWYTAYGDHPQILTGAIAEDMRTMQQALASEEWAKLKENLLNYVTDYDQKIIRASGGFQL